MNLREAIARELEQLGQDELKLVLTFVRTLASPASSRGARADHYLQAIMRLLITERAAEALEKMWEIAQAQGITDEDVLEEIQAHRARRLNQQQGYSLL